MDKQLIEGVVNFIHIFFTNVISIHLPILIFHRPDSFYTVQITLLYQDLNYEPLMLLCGHLNFI